jgi:hypothetical protein
MASHKCQDHPRAGGVSGVSQWLWKLHRTIPAEAGKICSFALLLYSELRFAVIK